MSRVIEVPSVLDERGFERLVADLAEHTSGEREPERILFDARRVRWTSPYGLVGLLAVGDVEVNSGELLNFEDTVNNSGAITVTGSWPGASAVTEVGAEAAATARALAGAPPRPRARRRPRSESGQASGSRSARMAITSTVHGPMPGSAPRGGESSTSDSRVMPR